MSAGDVALLERAVEAFNRRDREAFIEVCHPHVELIPLRAALEDTVYRGWDGMQAFHRDTDEAWQGIRVEDVAIEDLGEGRLLLSGTLAGRSAGSGVDTRAPLFWSVRMREGRIWRFTTHQERAGALAALDAS